MEVPEGIAKLGPDVVVAVEQLVRDARKRQQGDMAQALEDTMKIVPRPLRGVVRKVLVG